MSILDIPFINKYKTAISGYGLIILGIGGLLTAVGHCLIDVTVQECVANVRESYDAVLAALFGLGIIGVGHKVEKKS